MRKAEQATQHHWFAPWAPGVEGSTRCHYYAAGADGEASACGNYQRPFVCRSAGPHDTPCPRCIESFTLSGKPAPEFP